VVEYVVKQYRGDIKGVFAGSVPYLKLAGIVLGGWHMARAAGISATKLDANSASAHEADFYRAKIGTARFYSDYILSQAVGIRDSIVDGSRGVMALDEAQF
jgi:hypothetical protein